MVPNAKAFQSDIGLTIIVSTDNTPKWGPLQHVSVSKEDRYPSWDELLQIKEFFFGNKDCMMVMPKKEDYINHHSNCFHIWECPEGWGLK